MRFINIQFFAISASFLVGGCSVSGPDLTGNWKGKNISFEVSREGDVYRVIASNPSGFAGGNFSGKLEAGIINAGSPLCKGIAYHKENDKLLYCGQELVRVGKLD